VITSLVKAVKKKIAAPIQFMVMSLRLSASRINKDLLLSKFWKYSFKMPRAEKKKIAKKRESSALKLHRKSTTSS